MSNGVARQKLDLVNNVKEDLKDNNEGTIGAADIRLNLLDVIQSIQGIVASGDTDSAYPFYNDTRIKKDIAAGTGGKLFVESGILFPRSDADATSLQTQPYLGPDGIDHNDLANLGVGNFHPQYVDTGGLNRMVNGKSFRMGTGYIMQGSSQDGGRLALDEAHKGLRFESTGALTETVHVGSGTMLKFEDDHSPIKSGQQVAQAWIRFDATRPSVGETSANTIAGINCSYNIEKIQRRRDHLDVLQDGKFKIWFKDGTFDHANYVAVASSNAQGGTSGGDFTLCTVGIVERHKDYITFDVKQDDGDFVNASVNDIVIFGPASGVVEEAGPTIEWAETTT
tara:strand:+ start:2446 stop:3462 length:1017 start_codon:yes stop_codon:yes gene_type:complete